MSNLRACTCCDCGKKEMVTFSCQHFRCFVCDSALAQRVRNLAANRASREAIADAVGLPLAPLNRFLRKHGITTSARRGVAPKPKKQVNFQRGLGDAPAKLMPSRKALSLVNIFSLGA